MKIIVLQTLLIAAFLTAGFAEEVKKIDEEAAARTEEADREAHVKLSPFSNLGSNIYDSFIGYNTFFHLGGIGLTFLMVYNDWDYAIYRDLRSWKKAKPYFYPSVIIGTSCWLSISMPLLFYGYFKSDSEALGAAYAVLQSTLISIVYATIVKSITGRPPPDEKWNTDMRHQSRVFRFGFLRGGIFYGWPGGHVMITTATVASLMSYYPDKWWIKVTGALLVAYTMIGVTVHGGHWMSDNIAGLLMGYAIGMTVGKSFRRLVNKKLGISEQQVEFVPVVGFSSFGMSFTYHY
jgi:membrane-associated phospholipid phosphatase